MRCTKCGNLIPKWAHGSCPRCTYTTTTPVRKKPTKSKHMPKPTAKCSICNVSVRVTKLARHKRKAHGIGTTQSSTQPVNTAKKVHNAPKINKVSSYPTTKCPICNVIVKPKNLDRHKRKVHGIGRIQSSLSSIGVTKKARSVPNKGIKKQAYQTVVSSNPTSKRIIQRNKYPSKSFSVNRLAGKMG